MATRLRYDGVETRLANDLLAGTDNTTIEFTSPLVYAGGRQVPSLQGDEYIPLSIFDPNYRLREIVWLNYYDSATPLLGTVTRAQEGTNSQFHPSDVKVVNAATVLDYTLVQNHNNDPNAHEELFNQIRAEIDAKIAAHNVDPNAHQYLARKDNPTFTGTATFENIVLNKIMTVKPGARITINTGGSIQIEGSITINGSDIYVSNDPPPAPNANTVWIKTFG